MKYVVVMENGDLVGPVALEEAGQYLSSIDDKVKPIHDPRIWRLGVTDLRSRIRLAGLAPIYLGEMSKFEIEKWLLRYQEHMIAELTS